MSGSTHSPVKFRSVGALRAKEEFGGFSVDPPLGGRSLVRQRSKEVARVVPHPGLVVGVHSNVMGPMASGVRHYQAWQVSSGAADNLATEGV